LDIYLVFIKHRKSVVKEINYLEFSWISCISQHSGQVVVAWISFHWIISYSCQQILHSYCMGLIKQDKILAQLVWFCKILLSLDLWFLLYIFHTLKLYCVVVVVTYFRSSLDHLLNRYTNSLLCWILGTSCIFYWLNKIC